jgi:hypothetical protein
MMILTEQVPAVIPRTSQDIEKRKNIEINGLQQGINDQ